MGLLDDAIREHLDLKRRRGADPAELERAQREALGPVRRESFEPGTDGVEAQRAGGTASGTYDQEEEVYEDEGYEDEGDWGDAFDDEPELPSAGEESAREADDATRVMGRDSLEEEFAEPATSREDPAPPPYSAGPVSDETAAYDVEEALAAEEDGDPAPEPEALPAEGDAEPQTEPQKKHGDDVLEETPDFLQDTPDHDRLWFEQRPPRDFDFDG